MNAKTVTAFLAIVCLTAATSRLSAQEASFKKTRLESVTEGHRRFLDVDLRISDDKIVIEDKKSGASTLEIPLKELRTMSYRIVHRHRLGEGAALTALSPAAGLALMTTKSESHWLTLEYSTSTSTTESVLRLDKREYKKVLEALEEKSGQKVTILADDESKAKSGQQRQK